MISKNMTLSRFIVALAVFSKIISAASVKFFLFCITLDVPGNIVHYIVDNI